jgi:dsDNA-specific endonuclease/ATPase MutS2
MSNAGRISSLRQILEWYADRANYDDEHAPGHKSLLFSWTFDEGERARQAIETDNEAADADMARIRQIAETEVANLATRTHEPISTDCEEAETEIRKLTEQVRIATETLEHLAAGGGILTIRTEADDALIQMSAVD